MKVQSITTKKSIVELNRDELMILNNALNEVCHGIYVEEFQTRMGAEREEVQRLLNQIKKLKREMDQIGI